MVIRNHEKKDGARHILLLPPSPPPRPPTAVHGGRRSNAAGNQLGCCASLHAKGSAAFVIFWKAGMFLKGSWKRCTTIQEGGIVVGCNQLLRVLPNHKIQLYLCMIMFCHVATKNVHLFCNNVQLLVFLQDGVVGFARTWEAAHPSHPQLEHGDGRDIQMERRQQSREEKVCQPPKRLLDRQQHVPDTR